jgi:putative flippase GtrA
MWRQAIKSETVGQIARFCVVGAMNTLVGLLAIYVNIYIFGMGNVTGNLCGYIFGLLFGFFFHRNWTFRARTTVWVAGLKYALAFAIAYLVNISCVLALLRMGVLPVWAQAGGVIPYTISFFLLSRFVVFPQAKPK